ncbi:MAG TPA: CRISPR-associated helicase/endonuclease Cas3, partial [Ignavibacteriales bacterium]|nr:CRISPR-associated helicase/endonuclease Cas3 [Ignavibacteriales bacterium]
MKEFIAHVKQEENGSWAEPHFLVDHLNDTANKAGTFASEFGNKDWGELVGFWHDLGKFLPAWQKYLCRKSGFDPEAHIEESNNRPNHSTAGAVLPFVKFNDSPAAKLLAYVIGGHHAGLPDWYAHLDTRLLGEDSKLNTVDIEIIKNIPETKQFLEKPIPKTIPSVFINKDSNKINESSNEQLHLWVRMLFSCLVDADFLDTEKYMDEKGRGGYRSFSELKELFDNYMTEKKSDSELNKKRNEILEQCRNKASLPPGFFSLNVPTGGGKTLSSMAFALNHALKHDKKRIIMAIPYTSIIEQTAKVFKYGTDNNDEIEQRKKIGKYLFGENQVVEHHSNLDPENESSKNRLAAENWDAPIIVTTNVQLFESLFANRTSACRKLHNITNSIIILDEAQMLPPEYLKPILSVLKGLVDYFGVTVVMMTATQPALIGKIGIEPNSFEGLTNITNIIDDPDSLTKVFKRVDIKFPDDLNKRKNWEEIAEELKTFDQVLCVVNTKNDCRQLHSLMPEGTVHLSAFMCGEERSEIISEIKTKLKNREPIKVISTQLVEAGVDIDFPVVYRALAGLDSIAQAAGRCNRENNLFPNIGNVVVFNPPKQAPPGLLRKGEDACKAIIRNQSYQELTPRLYTDYFKYLYTNLNTFDEPEFYNHLVKDASDFTFQFRTFAQKFNLIDSM